MAKGVRVKKYSRRTSSRRGGGRVFLVILILLVFVLLCFAIAVATGIALGNKADSLEDKGGYELPPVEYTSGDKKVRGVIASAYSISVYAEGDVSVTLRHSDGSLAYASEIAQRVGFDANGVEALDLYADSVHTSGGYICGVFFVTSFNESDRAMREIYKSYEISLISEIAALGVDDILLAGIGVTDGNVAEVEEYLAKAAASAGDVPVGVCLARNDFPSSAEEQYRALRLYNACDYFAIDAGSVRTDGGMSAEDTARQIVDDMYYYIEAYSLRLVIPEEKSELFDEALALGINNIQKIKK